MSRTRSGRPGPFDPRLLRASPALRRHVVVLAAAISLRTLCTILGAGFLAAAVAHVLHGRTGAVLHRDLVGLAVAVVARAAVDGLLELTGERAGGRFRRDLRSAAMRGLADAGPSGLGAVDQARTAHVLGPGSDVLVPYVSRVLPALVGAVVTPVGVLAAVLLTDLPSFVLLVVVLPLLPLFLALVGMTTRERTARSYATLARVSAKVLDLLQGLPTLKVYGRAEGQVRAMERLTEQHRTETFSALRWAFVSSLALDVLATLSVALVAVDAGLRLQSGSLALAPALTALLLAPEVFGPLRAVGMQFHASTEALECSQVLLGLVEMPAQVSPAGFTNGAAAVDLDVVSVRHPGRTVDALRAVSLVVRPGEVVAIEGPSGAGKSTLLDVLSGARTPDAGVIRHPPSTLTWRSRLAICPQRPHASGSTAGDELRLAVPGASSEQIEQALADCAAPTARTALGESGDAISAGQLRRVCLARVLLRARAVLARGETPLLLLDEPSEDLDVETATVVNHLVDQLRGRATIVLVTHSAELAQIADRRIHLHAGQVLTDLPCAPLLPLRTALPEQLDRAAAPVPHAPEVRLRPVLRSLRSDARGLGGRLALAFGASAAAGAAALGLSASSGWLILRAAQHPGVQALAVAVVAVRASALAKAGLRYADRLSSHDLALRVLTRTRVRVLRALVPLAPTGLDLWRRGDLLRRFTSDIDAVQDVVIRGALPAMGAVATGLLGLLVIAPLAPSAVLPVALLLICTCGVLLLAAWGGSLGLQDAAEMAGARDQAAVAWVEGFPALWAYEALDAAAARIRDADAEADHANRPARVAGAVAAAACSACAGLAPVLVLAAASGSADALLVGVAALLAATAVEPLAALGSTWAALRGACLRAARVSALLAMPVPVPWPCLPAPAPVGPLGLDLADVTLARGQVATAGLNLMVSPGSRVAVTGPSGCGKSTLLATTLRLLLPADGTVSVVGPHGASVVADLTPEQMPRAVAGCLQGDHVFDASLRENLRIGRPSATDADLDGVAERLDLLDWVRDLPAGWATPAGPDGNRLSGGQRQRLLLARALLADPEILVLDEPTAHLDQVTERRVLADLLQATAGRTVLLTTHRTAALRQLGGIDTWCALGVPAPDPVGAGMA